MYVCFILTTLSFQKMWGASKYNANIVLVNIVSYLCRGIFRVLIQYQPKHHLEIVTSHMFIFRLVQRMNRSPRTSWTGPQISFFLLNVHEVLSGFADQFPFCSWPFPTLSVGSETFLFPSKVCFFAGSTFFTVKFSGLSCEDPDNYLLCPCSPFFIT